MCEFKPGDARKLATAITDDDARIARVAKGRA